MIFALLILLASAAHAVEWPTGCHIDHRPRKERIVCQDRVSPWYWRITLHAIYKGEAVYYADDLKPPYARRIFWGAAEFGPFPADMVRPGKTFWGNDEDHAIPYFFAFGEKGTTFLFDGKVHGPYQEVGDMQVIGDTFILIFKRDDQWYVRMGDQEFGPFLRVARRIELWDRNHVVWYGQTTDGWFVYYNDQHNQFAYDRVEGLVFEADLDTGTVRAVIRVMYNKRPYSVDLHKDPIEWVPTTSL